ncbi:MAG: hypothetical protein GDA68_15500 [Nitrospira sp. CR2.1]|nr:hypothetical protein [Nitrospira sp. CR2.1]
MSFDDEKESVRSLLRRAFSAWHSDPTSLVLEHEQCLDMRARLFTVKAEDIEYFLPQVLEDLLDTHTGEAGQSEDVETVVDFLDVPTLPIDVEFVKHKWAGEALAKFRKDDQELRARKELMFARATTEQAQAFCAWLQYARTWGDLEWNTDSVESALSYWLKRVHSRSPN